MANFFSSLFSIFLFETGRNSYKKCKKVFFLFFYQNTGILSSFSAFWVIFFALFIFLKNLMKISPKMQVFLCFHVGKHQISYKSVKIYCFRMLKDKKRKKINSIGNFVKKWNFGKKYCSFGFIFCLCLTMNSFLNFQSINMTSPLYFAKLNVE